MFTTLKYRRHIAVLTALAMVASVLVAAPAVAAAHPEADFTADFDACGDAPSSGFSDVPTGHANAGDIDCIAYYGITKGTSATTYSPLMSVTREHMALFLTRLAGLVGITVASNPSDPGFTDTGDLSAESQTAIAQLYDLGITTGTSMTTYSPADNVKRGHMALFIQRLMNKMTPIGGSKSTWGHTPSDVADDTTKKDASPFTDLGSSTKNEYDAITQLWELGVASGISATAYAPSSDITRAAMAGFMAGVLDHSNARPSGVTIQATPSSKFGNVMGAAVVISVRNDSFAPVADQAVDHFNSTAANGGISKGKCITTGENAPFSATDCTWNDTDDFTGKDGNLVLSGETAGRGQTKVYHAWIGAKDGDKFDANKVDYDSASITAKKDEKAMKTSSTINKNATNSQVDLDTVNSVTITVQLVDEASANTAAAGAKAVARSGQKIQVGVSQKKDLNGDGDNDDEGETTAVLTNTKAAVLTTDADGKVTFTVNAPADDNDKDDMSTGDNPAPVKLEDRTDTITFTYLNADNGGDLGTGGAQDEEVTIRWSEKNSVTTKATASADPYVVPAGGKARVMATVTFLDQYGNSFRQGSGQKVGIQFGSEEGSPQANVNGNGIARRAKSVDNPTVADPITVSYTANPTEDPDVVISGDGVSLTNGSIQVVAEATDASTGSKKVHTLYADSDKFTAEHSDDDSDAGLLYSYDSGDTFLQSGNNITMAKFEELLKNPSGDTANPAVVNVVRYNPNGESIFVVTTTSATDG